MSRRRLNVPGGTYYVVQLSSAQQQLFSELDHYALFERLMARAVQRTHTKVLGYCWLPRNVHLVLQAGAVPIGRFLQGFTATYARTIHREAGASGHLFAQRHRATLLDPERWLLPLLRYIHFLPVREGLATRPEDWPHSSHSAYLTRRRVPWLSTQEAYRLLEAPHNARETYTSLFSHPPVDDEVRVFEPSGAADGAVIGERTDIRRQLTTSKRSTRFTVETIMKAVLQLVDAERDELFSNSRRQKVVLARALIAWHVTERRLETLSEIARRFGRDPSTLSVAIRRYRNKRKDLFRLDAISVLSPLG
jgi:REP element-mobilizing transposase RayT